MNTTIQGVYYAVLPAAPQDGQSAPLTLTNDYSLRTNITAGTVTLGGGVALADDMANPTVPLIGSFLMGFDGTNWDRLRGITVTGATVAPGGTSLSAAALNYGFDSATTQFRRARLDSNSLALVSNAKPLVSSTDQFTPFALVESDRAIIKAAAAQLCGLDASNSSATGLWACVLNQTGLPAAGNAILKPMWVAAGRRETLDTSFLGLQCWNLSTGLAICWSTTPTTVTLPASATGLAIDIRYV